METRFLRLRTPVELGSWFDDWQVCWLGGWAKHRLYFLAHLANGENAENVLGQSDYVSNGSASTQSGLSGEWGISYDSINNRLFVADTNNNRVVVFDASTSTIANGENAENVLGQPDFTSTSSATTRSGLLGEWGVLYDAPDNRLFVGDTDNNRVLEFNFITLPSAAYDSNVGAPYDDTLTPSSSQGTVSFTHDQRLAPCRSDLQSIHRFDLESHQGSIYLIDRSTGYATLLNGNAPMIVGLAEVVVSEPSSALLFALGLGALLVRSLRRARTTPGIGSSFPQVIHRNNPLTY
jgi:DNA-binding beta-propeller fold protein YncE